MSFIKSNVVANLSVTGALLVALIFAACDDSTSAASSDPVAEISSSSGDKAIHSSSSVDSIGSSSSATLTGDEKSSSSVEKSKSSSSSVIPASSGDLQSSSSVKPESSSTVTSSATVASSSSVTEQSSSSKQNPWGTDEEWWPFSCNAFGGCLEFTDERNGRTYKYLKFEGMDTLRKAATIYAMVENLNVGEMVRGFKDQKDDAKIERYCYDNDTLNCRYYGGLYQWAEMMNLPFECNSKSCADSIKPNHQGICPDGWRLLTYNDFYIIVNSNGNTHGVEGVRSTFGFGGYNSTGYSLVGGGARNTEGKFEQLNKAAYWFYLVEYTDVQVVSSWTSPTNDKIPESHLDKSHGLSVRCVKAE